MIMRLCNTRMAGVVIHVNMIYFARSHLQIFECNAVVDVFQGDHVNSAYQLTVAVISQERPGRQ